MSWNTTLLSGQLDARRFGSTELPLTQDHVYSSPVSSSVFHQQPGTPAYRTCTFVVAQYAQRGVPHSGQAPDWMLSPSAEHWHCRPRCQLGIHAKGNNTHSHTPTHMQSSSFLAAVSAELACSQAAIARYGWTRLWVIEAADLKFANEFIGGGVRP
jgi:hypothetical protein